MTTPSPAPTLPTTTTTTTTTKKIRWGILSTGWIASCFTHALEGVAEAEVVAVGSRNKDKAEEFGDKYKIPHKFGSYEELAQCPDVDAIYIATPHNSHKEYALLCLNNNKHILVEKSFAVNAAETKEVLELAKTKNLFVMEAMWTRFFPANQKVREIIRSKSLGEVQYLSAELCFNAFASGKGTPDGRLLNPHLAGGALLDIGIYPISYASFIFERAPSSVDSHVLLTDRGIDEQFSAFFKYEGGASAYLYGSLRAITPREALIVCSNGYIRVPRFFCPDRIIIGRHHQPEEILTFPWPDAYPTSYDQNGLFYEAQAVTRFILEGKTDNDVMPTSETVTLMETMDALRAKWGVVYPQEKKE